MKIVWDEPKRLANIDKHGLDFAVLDLQFFRAALVVKGHSGRFKGIGRLGNAIVAVVVFVPLGREAISLVSLRHASAAERSLFDGQSQAEH